MEDIDRRGALRLGGLAAAGTLGAAPAVVGNRIMFGANRGYWDQFHAAIPLGNAVRVYYNGENSFPSAWPARLPSSAWISLSVQPNPSDLLSGKLNARLLTLIRSAPAHAELAFWHENIPGNPLGYPGYVNNPQAAVAMSRYGHRLCQGSRVRFGSIIVGPVTSMMNWIALGLDWYGIDFYDFPHYRYPNGNLNVSAIFARMDSNLSGWRKLAGMRHPSLRICECNSRIDSHRVTLFTALAKWMAANGGHRIMTFWKPSGAAGVSGPWPPSDGVVDSLLSLAQTYRM